LAVPLALAIPQRHEISKITQAGVRKGMYEGTQRIVKNGK
jgi:hypothetical protein